MPKRDDRISMEQILEHAREAVTMVAEKPFKDLCNERML